MILFLTFLFSSFAFFLQMIPSFFLPIQPFLPWMILFVLRTKGKSFFLLAILGFFLDLFTDHPLGLYPISYVLLGFLIAYLRNRISVENPLHFSIASGFYSLISSLLILFILFLLTDLETGGSFLLFFDFVAKAVFDAIYGLIWIFPFILCEDRGWFKIKKLG